MRGSIQRIPPIYSFELSQVINLMLTVDHTKRPSCTDLLQFISKLKQSKKVIPGPPSLPIRNQSPMLKTITAPKDFRELSVALPKPNYRNIAKETSVSLHSSSKTE